MTGWKLAVLLAATVAAASGADKAPRRILAVCLDPGGNAATIDGARAAASRVFDRVGIQLDWRNTEGRCAGGRGLIVTVALATPNDQHPGALAYAMPYEATHIVLLYDRVLATVARPAVPSLMGYVLAHEIAHMLEGVDRHSPEGVMKAHWSSRDYADMQLGRLSFAPENVELMREGVARFAASSTAR